MIIPPNGGIQQINLATLEKIPFQYGQPAPQGSIEMEVEYGPAADQLNFLHRYVAETQVGLTPVPKSKEVRVEISARVVEFEHSKVK